MNSDDTTSAAFKPVLGVSNKEVCLDKSNLSSNSFQPNPGKETCNNLTSEESVYMTFPIHSIVLCISSDFFKKLLLDSGMKENSMNVVTLKVNKGEGKHLELLIEAFYSIDVLTNISLSDLLCTLNVAARFSCFDFIQLGLDRLNHSEIKTVSECDIILSHISYILELFENSERYENIKNCCTKFLAKKFFPIEMQFEQQRVFNSLSHCSVTLLMMSNHVLVVSENNALSLIYQWLLHNEDLQTPEIIESLLMSIRYQNLHVDQFCDSVSVCDKILNKWSSYSSWYVDVLKYHALPQSARNIRGIKELSASRAYPITICNLAAKRHFRFEKENSTLVDEQFFKIIWGGGCLVPLLSLKEANENFLVKLKVKFVNIFQPELRKSFIHQNIDVYYCLLPGYVEFKDSMMQIPKFVQKYVRRGVLNYGENKTVHNYHSVAKFSADFVEKVWEHGLNLIILFTGTAAKNIDYFYVQIDLFFKFFFSYEYLF